MLRVALVLMLAGLLATTAGHAQESTHYKTWPESLRQSATEQPGWQSAAITRAPIPLEPLDPVVMYGGKGGSIPEHHKMFFALNLSSAPVEMRGGCYSACTLITGYISKDRLCFAPGAFLAFHAARMTMDGPIAGGATIAMVNSYPPEIRSWIDRNGGVGKLPRDGFWTMYDRELWAIGYPRCK